MTIVQRKLFAKGREYWNQYVNLNGYAFKPSNEGLKILSGATNTPKKELQECINVFLDN